MNVSVLGPGAIGSMSGGLLLKKSTDVYVLLLLRGEHGRVVGERGEIALVGASHPDATSTHKP